MSYVVGTWTFTDPDMPLTTPLYAVRLDPLSAGVVSDRAAAAYYGTAEPGGDTFLLLHNDIDRSALSRQRVQPDGTVVEEGRWSSGGVGGSYIAFDPGGTHFVVANAHTGWAVFRNGTEPEQIAALTNVGHGPHPRQGKSHPHCAIFSPSGEWIYAADMGSDEVLAYGFDATRSAVGEKVVAYRAAPGSGPRHLVARHGLVYLLNELGNTLVVLEPQADGTLAERQVVATLPEDFADFSHTAHLEISDDGRHLYASNRGHDSILVADLGHDGLVTGRRWVASGGAWPWFFCLTDGRMLVANNRSDDLAVFDVDATGGLRQAHSLRVPCPAFVLPLPVRTR